MSADESHTPTDIQLARNGDESALERLIEKHFATLTRTIAQKIDSRWQSQLDAEDVMQQTGIDAFLRIGDLRAEDEDGFVGWLLRIADRNLLDVIRRLDADKRPPPVRRLERPGGESTASLYDALFGVDSETPSRVVGERESQQLLLAALERLPADYREVVRLYDLQGLSMAEVAAALDRRTGAAHMLRMRAHALLRQILTAEAEKSPASA